MHKLLQLRRAGFLFAVLSASSAPSQTAHPIPEPALAALPSVSASSHIIPTAPNFTFPNGQTYVYAVEWHLFTAGTARVGLGIADGQEHVTAIADSAGVVNALYKVHDRFDAWFDPHTACSQRVVKETEEGSHARHTEVHLDYPRKKATLDEKNLKTGEQKHVDNDLAGCVTDVVSGFYYLATLPLQPGNTYIFPVSDGGKAAEVKAVVETREQIKVPAGTFQAIRVKAEAISGTLQGKGTVGVWFTDDANHTPVQMRSKLGWGTLLFRLQRIEK
jgi:hypothetical protein